jgi:acetyl-CoA C-acetyltransferase
LFCTPPRDGRLMNAPRVFVAGGLRTPFTRAGGAYAARNALGLSVEVLRACEGQRLPGTSLDYLGWGQVIPDSAVSNIAREAMLDAGLDASTPAVSTVMACASSLTAALQAGAMMGRGDTHLALVGGVETMGRLPIALNEESAQRLLIAAKADPSSIVATLRTLNATDFRLPGKGWSNRTTGRSMGEHTEDLAKSFHLSRVDQDRIALSSHTRAADAWRMGFFSDLVFELDGVKQDSTVRADTSASALAALAPVFDRNNGTLTAGNSSPLTDGAAAVWVADEEGLGRLAQGLAVAEIVDWQLSAVDFAKAGMLMAPAYAIPRLLARHGLKFSDIALWEIHEAFAAQVLANIRLMSDPAFAKEQLGISSDFGKFPWERVNPNGGSLALGHPFAATGARLLSQAAKWLKDQPADTLAIVSICADGGQGAVALLRKP